MEHIYQECDCEESGCPICMGGLSCCTVCGGLEGSLTTECCGRRLSEDEINRIYSVGDLDFRDGEFVNEPNPCNQMWKGVIYES